MRENLWLNKCNNVRGKSQVAKDADNLTILIDKNTLMNLNKTLRAFTMVSLKFGSEVGPAAATSAYEPNFRLASHSLCIAQLTTLAH